MRQFVNSDKKKLCALILVNVTLVPAVAKPRSRTVGPGNQVLRFVVALIESLRYVATEIREQRRFQLRVSSSQEQRVRSIYQNRLEDSFPEQRFRFAGACGTAEEPVPGRAQVKLFLAIERLITFAEKHLPVDL